MKITKYLISLVLSVFIISSSANAANAPESFADLVEELTPAVVNISTTQTLEGGVNPLEELFSNQLPENSPFNDFFKRFQNPNGQDGKPIERKTNSLGSGFIIDETGYIVTNHHVVDKADEITVIFSDDTKVDAKVIGTDPKTDIALLKIEVDRKLPYVKWGDSDKARVGDWVIAIGNPFGLGGSVSAGIISARARDINAGPFDDFIQTDAAINRGNSGGPLFNVDGDVIGVNSAIFSPSGGSVGIGFSVPTALAEPVVRQLKETGSIERGWLGVKIQTVTEDIADSLGLKKDVGALVLEVTDESPASAAGILSGDVILTFDGKEVAAMRKLPRIVAETPVGKKVPVVVWGKGKKITLVVTIARLDEGTDNSENAPEEDPKKEDNLKDDSTELLGLKVKKIDNSTRKYFSLDENIKGLVVVDVIKNGVAAEKRILKGDVIISINQVEVETIDQASKVVAQAKTEGRKSALLLLNRGGSNQFIAVPFENK